MYQNVQNLLEENVEDQPKWFNSPVKLHVGTITELREFIPTFERRDFALTHPDSEFSRKNERLDTIVRLPLGEDNNFIPVGIVSKNYTLVQHRAVLDIVNKSISKMNIQFNENIQAELKITEYGERMSFSVFLPDQYSYKPLDGHTMALRLICFNSVDGSTHFRAIMSWFRLVCSNGLIIGVTRHDIRRRHLGEIQLNDISDVLISGLNMAEVEKTNFVNWQNSGVTSKQLIRWVNKNLKEKWGFKAAARAYHIACSGYDAEVKGSYKGHTPATIKMNETIRVQGSPEECRNLFDMSQILAWLAKERRDIQEQLAWQESIPDLMAALSNKQN